MFPESSIGLSGGILDDLAIDPASKGRFAFFTDSGVGPVTRAQVQREREYMRKEFVFFFKSFLGRPGGA